MGTFVRNGLTTLTNCNIANLLNDDNIQTDELIKKFRFKEILI